ncbi:MAG: hypothetical protein ACXWPS_08615 [Ktedonobacteraceae bacterium]
METIPASNITWSEEKLKRLQVQLTGMWAEEAWPVKVIDGYHERQCLLHFEFVSPALTIEFKYALWTQFERGQRKREGNNGHLYYGLQLLTAGSARLLPRALLCWKGAWKPGSAPCAPIW